MIEHDIDDQDFDEEDKYDTNNFYTIFDALNEASRLSRKDRILIESWFELPVGIPFPVLRGNISDFSRESPLPRIKIIEQQCNHAWTKFREKYPDLYSQALQLQQLSDTYYYPVMRKLITAIVDYSHHPNDVTQRQMDRLDKETNKLALKYSHPTKIVLSEIMELILSDISEACLLNSEQKEILLNKLLG